MAATRRGIYALFRVAAWLSEAGLISATGRQPQRWRARLAQNWMEITSNEDDAHQPRHTEAEVGVILANLDRAEPRLALMIEAGLELRNGQLVERAMRSNLHLSRVGGFGLSRLQVVGKGRKLGELIAIHPTLRERLDESMRQGHPSLLESVYRRGEIQDYPLFPQGKLCRCKATVARAGEVRAESRRLLREGATVQSKDAL